MAHRGTRALFAIAQGGVKNQDAVLFVFIGHVGISFVYLAILMSFQREISYPLSARAVSGTLRGS
jgi:hypothetical protein